MNLVTIHLKCLPALTIDLLSVATDQCHFLEFYITETQRVLFLIPACFAPPICFAIHPPCWVYNNSLLFGCSAAFHCVDVPVCLLMNSWFCLSFFCFVSF